MAKKVEQIRDDIGNMWYSGDIPSMIVTSDILKQKIVNLYGNRVREEAFEPFGGTLVPMIIDPLNPEGGTAIIVHEKVEGEYYLLDSRKLTLGNDKRLNLDDIDIDLIREVAFVPCDNINNERRNQSLRFAEDTIDSFGVLGNPYND